MTVWDAATGNVLCFYDGHHGSVKAVGWSPGGVNIASGSDDATVQVWNGMTGKLVAMYKGHTRWVRTLDWSPDGEFIASASDKDVHVWYVK